MKAAFRIKGRKGWHGEVTLADGRLRRKHFRTKKVADEWVAEETANVKADHAPYFGGPSGIVLGQMLGEYAGLFTITKLGYAAELSRINHYVTAVGLPRLRIRVNADNQRTLEAMPDELTPVVPKAFKADIDTRLKKSQRTYDELRELANKKVNKLTTHDLQHFKATMVSDGLSDSTIQKEFALLKAAFNSAIRTWNWEKFKNPCLGIKLGSSNRRFVVLTTDDETRLFQAISECDNPLIWPIVEIAIASTLRKGTLLCMTWKQINLETGQAQLWAKGKMVDVTFSPRSLEILRQQPRSADGRVFPMSSNALDMAWDGVRVKAGLKGLQFRDLRHVGATFLARAGLNVFQLQKVLTHSTTRMAEIYVNLAQGELQTALAQAELMREPPLGLPPTHNPNGLKKKPRMRKSAALEDVDANANARAVRDNVYYIRGRKDNPKLKKVSEAKDENPDGTTIASVAA